MPLALVASGLPSVFSVLAGGCFRRCGCDWPAGMDRLPGSSAASLAGAVCALPAALILAAAPVTSHAGPMRIQVPRIQIPLILPVQLTATPPPDRALPTETVRGSFDGARGQVRPVAGGTPSCL